MWAAAMFAPLLSRWESLAERTTRAVAGVPPWLVALGLVSASAGFLSYAALPPEPAHAALVTEVRVLDRVLRAEGDASAEALALARAYLRTELTVRVGAWDFAGTRASVGARVDLAGLERLLRDARDAHSALRRFHAQHHGDAPLIVHIPVQLDPEQGMAWARRIRDQVARREIAARMDTQTWQPVPEEAGLALDVQATLDNVESALASGATQVAARVQVRSATRTVKELENHDFRAILGSFETRYSSHDKDRSYNLKVAARHVDGLVLLPGEVFDFNRIVGERSEANGFRPAHVIAGGELTDGVGGGTCQIAGTLYAAVYFAGLDILERSTHTRPSAYLKLGLDATVSYPKLNLRFKNDLDQAVAVSARVENGKVRVELRGKGTTREVSFVRRVDDVTPYNAVSRGDSELPDGARVLSQRGVPGFEVTSFRVIRDRATGRVVRERNHDVYPPTQQIWRIGRGGVAHANAKLPAHDARGEYTADEYLILTYTSAARGAEEVKRVEGRSGSLGWTQREGMPQPAL